MAKKLQLKRSDVIYENRTSALNELNTYVQSNINELLDGEPLVGRYYDNGVCKAILGIVYKKANISGVYYFDTEGSQQGQLVPADESISIENDQISVNLKSGEDNVLKLDENGLFVSLDELIEKIPQTDLSEVESAITATQKVAFGEPIESDMESAQPFYVDDANLSGATSLVEADKILSEKVDENSLAIETAFNNLNDRLEELSGKTPSIEELESLANDIEVISGVVDDNSLTIAAAFNNLNDRVNELSGSTIPTSRIEEIEQNVASLQGDVADIGEDVGELENSLDDVQDSIETLESGLTSITKVIIDNELVVAASLNDLNSRILDLSGSSVSNITSSSLVITQDGNTFNIELPEIEVEIDGGDY